MIRTLVMFIVSQIWALGCLFPLIVGRYVPDGDKRLENYLMMLEITDYLLTPEVTLDEAA